MSRISTRRSSRNRALRSSSSFCMENLESRTLLSANMLGSVDGFSGSEIFGWGFNTSTPNTPVTIQITIDGGTPVNITASQSRPDLKSYLGTANAGFFYVPSVSVGAHSVVVSEIDSTNGQSTVLKAGTIQSGPIGSVDVLNGGVIMGWAFDSATPTSNLTLHVKIDNTTFTTTTGGSRPDVGGALGNPNVGFFYNPPDLSPGQHSVTVSVVDPQTGNDVTLATSSINSNPIGSIDVLTLNQIVGWVYDPAVRDNPVNLEILVDGNLNATGVANTLRPDIGPAFNNDANHGYAINLSGLSSASHVITLVEVNADNSTTTVLTQTLSDTVIGSLDIATPGMVAGWAFDPFAPNTPVQVTYQLDGVNYTPVSANTNRPDLTVLPNTQHGYLSEMPTNFSGSHVLKVFATNPDTGVQTLLGTKTFVNNAPAGVVQAASSSSISGYAYDPDEPTTSLQILLYVDGTAPHYTDNAPIASVVANINQSALTGTIGSPNHGFNIPISGLTPGTHTLTIYAIDPDTLVGTLIGTETVTA